MSDESYQAGSQADWLQALDALEHSLRQGLDAIRALRHMGVARTELRPPAVAQVDDEPAFAPEPVGWRQEPDEREERDPPAGGQVRSPFERLWDRHEKERQIEEQGAGEPPLKGLAALPTQYVFTIEDVEGKADLVAIHRALQSLQGVRDMWLMSFVNGVPIVAVNAERELDLAKLGQAIGEATDRDCNIMTQDGPKVHVRLRARQQGAA